MLMGKRAERSISRAALGARESPDQTTGSMTGKETQSSWSEVATPGTGPVKSMVWSFAPTQLRLCACVCVRVCVCV